KCVSGPAAAPCSWRCRLGTSKRRLSLLIRSRSAEYGPPGVTSTSSPRAWCVPPAPMRLGRAWMRSSPPRPSRPLRRMRSPAAVVDLASDYADYVYGTGLTVTAGGSPSDRPVLSGGSTALLWRTGAGRIVGSVTSANGATRRSPEPLKEKIMEKVEQSGRPTDRRSFLLKGAAVGVGAIGASRLLTAPPVSAR